MPSIYKIVFATGNNGLSSVDQADIYLQIIGDLLCSSWYLLKQSSFGEEAFASCAIDEFEIECETLGMIETVTLLYKPLSAIVWDLKSMFIFDSSLQKYIEFSGCSCTFENKAVRVIFRKDVGTLPIIAETDKKFDQCHRSVKQKSFEIVDKIPDHFNVICNLKEILMRRKIITIQNFTRFQLEETTKLDNCRIYIQLFGKVASSEKIYLDEHGLSNANLLEPKALNVLNVIDVMNVGHIHAIRIGQEGDDVIDWRLALVHVKDQRFNLTFRFEIETKGEQYDQSKIKKPFLEVEGIIWDYPCIKIHKGFSLFMYSRNDHWNIEKSPAELKATFEFVSKYGSSRKFLNDPAGTTISMKGGTECVHLEKADASEMLGRSLLVTYRSNRDERWICLSIDMIDHENEISYKYYNYGDSAERYEYGVYGCKLEMDINWLHSINELVKKDDNAEHKLSFFQRIKQWFGGTAPFLQDISRDEAYNMLMMNL